MAGVKSAKRKEIEARRAKVAKQYEKHVKQEDIAADLCVSEATICRDLKVIVGRWVEQAVGDVAPIKARELAELDTMEYDVASEWNRRRDPRLIELRLKIKERRARLLGLDAPTKIAPTDPTGDNPYNGMTDEQLRTIIASEAAKLSGAGAGGALSLDAPRSP